MTFLFPELDERDTLAMLSHTSAVQTWCNPSLFDEVIGLDFGCNVAHYYKSRSSRRGSMPFNELRAWLLRLPRNTLVVCESAHLGVPQTELSLAQPYTADELLALYAGLRSNGVTLKLAPHAHTGKRMRLWVSHHCPEMMRTSKKSDEADAMTLALYVDLCNEISLANPYKTFARSARRKFGREVTNLSNALLNVQRTIDYSDQFYPLTMRLARKVRRSAKFLGALSDNSKFKFVLSVASTLVSERADRLLVLTHRGHHPGRWFWLRDVLRMSAWHHRGGTARSNLMWHIFPPYLQNTAKRYGLSVKNGNQYTPFALYDDKQKAVLKLAKKNFRQKLLLCRDECIDAAHSMGAGQLELTDAITEVGDGR